TRRAVGILEAVKTCRREGGKGALELLALGQRLTDMNAAFFDVRGGFAGCIAGIGEVLRRQGLLRSRVCLDPGEDLSPGQAQEIERVVHAYPELTDDAFVGAHLDEWLQ
ncbi:MAG TPA: dihydrodipicolinate synthase family protein, partial [Vicinamibacteria bacterium]